MDEKRNRLPRVACHLRLDLPPRRVRLELPFANRASRFLG